jgi:tRNA (guanine37-N1)-methyltransferase
LKVSFITPFPNIIKSYVRASMLDKAKQKGLVEYNVHNLFDYADSPHYSIDDYPFGGGDGMILKPEPVFRAYDKIKDNYNGDDLNVIFPSPDGKVFSQREAHELRNENHIVFICGHYKGVDQRIRDTIVTKEYSIGDYIITGGELASLVIIDSIVRLVPGVLNNLESAQSDSFESDLLDCSYYTRPEEYRGLKVPNILLSGNHQRIDDYRKKDREKKTKKRRPDIWKKYNKI